MRHRHETFAPIAIISNRNNRPLSLSDTLEDLKRRGYRFKFRREGSWLYCVELGSWFSPDSFTIDEYYHFESVSPAWGDSMLYALASIYGLKGFLVDALYVYPGQAGTDGVEISDLGYTPLKTFIN